MARIAPEASRHTFVLYAAAKQGFIYGGRRWPQRYSGRDKAADTMDNIRDSETQPEQ